ncbi:MAG TPA: S41 family peptidase [Rhodothermales bacterium]|nr:S41 family peptidase [Rhodothermales bacterium]
MFARIKVALLQKQGIAFFLVSLWVFFGSVAGLSCVAQEVSGPIAQPPAEVATSIDNLRAFAKLYGYVRYFHPSDAASAIDWERFAIHGVREVKGASSPEQLQEKLEALFLPLAPTVQIYAAGTSAPNPFSLLTPSDTAGLQLVAWQHRGVGMGNQGPYQSVRLHRQTEVATGPGFGTITQQVDATPYQGKEVKLKAAVKTDVSGNGNQAQLWLRVDRLSSQVGFFDNMQDRPVTSPTWDTYEITGPISENAEYITFGGFLMGHGKVWLDSFELFVRENQAAGWTTVPLENTGFEAGALGDKPAGWGGRAPGYELTTIDEDAFEGERAALIRSDSKMIMASALFEKRPQAGEVVERPLGRGLSAQIPLALYSKDGQTLRPQEASSSLESLESALQEVDLNNITVENEALRYADVVIAWNIFQHFYPYFDVINTDWDEVLMRTLSQASTDSNAEDFTQTLGWMVAQLEDGHGYVSYVRGEPQARLPFLVEEIEDQLVIVAVADPANEDACYQRGDIVVTQDGKLASDVLSESLPYLSGSPQWKMVRAQRAFVQGKRGEQVAMTLQRADQTITCEVDYNYEGRIQGERPGPLEELRAGLYYVDLSAVEMSAVEQEAEHLAEADGVIFDLRGYPNSTHGVLQYLTDTPLRSAQWQVPQHIYPDQMDTVAYDTTGRWRLDPRKPQFTGTIVFLTDGRAISYAESVMGIVEHYQLGEIVGQPTAGANGNVNPFTLPGGYRISWTGMRVIKHDGSQHHLIGIQPTMPLERTLEGVRAGRDEYLEKAIEVIEQKTGSSQ